MLNNMNFRFLHTADLHLGKVFHEHSLLEDQKFMLDQLTETLTDTSYRALIIAGDVYDRSIPSPGAVSLFGGFLGALKARRSDLEVLILPGNHDSADRLGFGRELFAELGIHFVTDPVDADKPVIVRDSNTACVFFLLPFLHPGSLCAKNEDLPTAGSPDGDSDLSGGPESGGPLRSQARLAEEAAARLEKARLAALEAGATHTVLAAHLFTAGGVESNSERIFLGTAERVDAGLFSGFDYVALGHLHRHQKAGKNCRYSGSPLAYSFDETENSEKCFLSVELHNGESNSGDSNKIKSNNGKSDNGISDNSNCVTVTPIPVRPTRGVRRLRGSFNRFFREDDAELKEAQNDYLEIVLADSNLVENPLPLLRQRFPWVLSVRQEEALASLRENFPALSRGPHPERRSSVEDFEDFLADIYGDPAAPGMEGLAVGTPAELRRSEGSPPENREKIELFRELLTELEGGEDLL
jgi:exonuclease SbcD